MGKILNQYVRKQVRDRQAKTLASHFTCGRTSQNIGIKAYRQTNKPKTGIGSQTAITAYRQTEKQSRDKQTHKHTGRQRNNKQAKTLASKLTGRQTSQKLARAIKPLSKFTGRHADRQRETDTKTNKHTGGQTEKI